MQQLKRQQQTRNQLAESEATTNNLQKHNRAQQRKGQNAKSNT
jgi:hypothetical protein